ncbi:Dicer-like protein 2 [Oleoguttula sp. CCFEE 5521]
MEDMPIFDDDARHVAVKLRSYQHEMLEKSLQRNVIVAMDTGSGKTHVAISRIRAELERQNERLISDAQQVWFIAPSRALCEQQARVVSQELPAYHVKLLTGADDVEKWTTTAIWDAFLTGVHVVVSTPAILADALTHGFVTMRRLALCVFDECHRATKQHPMNKIMRDFYHPAKTAKLHVPHILGLSASPVMSTKANSVEAIEGNLDARTITPKQHRGALMDHVHLPQMIRVIYGEAAPAANDPLTPTCTALTLALRTYDVAKDPYVLELQDRDDHGSLQSLRKAIEKRKTYCIEQLQLVVNRAEVVREQLGSSMAEWYATTCCERFLRSSNHDNMIVFDLKEKEANHLRTVFKSARDQAAASQGHANHVCDHLSLKAQGLVDALRDHTTPEPRILVFVQQRATVSAVAHMLRSTSALSSMSFGTFTGTFVSAKRMNFVADLIDPKLQMNDLQDFRDGAKNVMICTDVLEEGIDVPALNGVFCFDLPKNLVSFVQRRGRARQPDSKYVLFMPESDAGSDPALWQTLENRMKEAYADDTRGQPEVPAEDEDELAVLKYQVPSTGALLTAHNAKSHLNHFSVVSTTGMSRYIDPRPVFDPREHATEKTWSATVTLPAFIHPTLRTSTTLSLWRSEGAAVKEASFRAYSTLHQAGLVNDYLLPPAREQRPEVGEVHVDQPSMVQVSGQRDVWRVFAQAASEINARWHAAEITISLNGSTYYSTTLWLPVEVPSVESIALHWDAGTTYIAAVRSLTDRATPRLHQLDLLARATQLILSSVFGSRMPPDRSDFTVLVEPANIETWLTESSGSQTTTEYLAGIHNGADSSPARIVHVQGQDHRAYVLHDLVSTRDTPVPSLLLRPFTKRRDFLHTIPAEEVLITAASNAANAAKEAVPASECNVANLPLSESVFAALLPSILHVIGVDLLAQKLRSDCLSAISFQRSELVVEAISAPAARERLGDYNRLEYLGDTMLKFFTELQLYAQHPIWPEAQLAAEKDRIVRNSNLARAAVARSLDNYVLTEPFTAAKWRPEYVGEVLSRPSEGTREISSKVLADVVESLVGAAYVDGGLDRAYTCVCTLLPNEIWWDLDVIMRSIHSDLPVSQPVAGLKPLEGLVGHSFANKTLLIEAITQASYEHNRSGMSYERLEFLGDAVLDLIITPKLFAHPRKLRHWELHRIHEALVNAHFLGYCCMSLSIGEATYDVTSAGSEKDTAVKVVSANRTLHLYDSLRANGEVNKIKREALIRHDKLREPLSSSLHGSAVYPWSDLLALRPDKFISDIVESLLGALYLDTHGDLDICEAFLEEVGILPVMRRILDDSVETAHPRERLGILADRDEVKYTTTREEMEASNTWRCAIKVGGITTAEVTRCGSREEAAARAAEAAIETLRHTSGPKAMTKRRKLVMETDDVMPDADSEMVSRSVGIH